MANDLRWHLMDPGVLLHVDRDLTVTRTNPFPDAPTRRLTLDDLDPVAAASQREGTA
jgi:glutamine amidotransferase